MWRVGVNWLLCRDPAPKTEPPATREVSQTSHKGGRLKKVVGRVRGV